MTYDDRASTFLKREMHFPVPRLSVEALAAEFAAVRREALEEACASIRGTRNVWLGYAERYRGEKDAWSATGCEARAEALAGAENNVRALMESLQ